MQSKNYILLALIVLVPLGLFIYNAIKEGQKPLPEENQQKVEERGIPSEN